MKLLARNKEEIICEIEVNQQRNPDEHENVAREFS